MTWTCPAFDHSVAVFPDEKIRPCCQMGAEYSKPISEINNPNRFDDLKTHERPDACRACWQAEDNNLSSYRQWYLKKVNPTPGIQFLDLRHSNQCNLKCRYCNPYFSNQWAKELSYQTTLRTTDISEYFEHLLTDDLVDLYFCGGEPLIIADHYAVLERLIASGQCKNVELRYNTNLTVIQYKDSNLLELWKNFKSVTVSVSLDAAGPELNYIRSGSDWETVSRNIEIIAQHRASLGNLKIFFAVTLSILNVWFLPALYAYALSKNISVQLTLLHGPDYLSLSAIHSDQLKNHAKQILNQVKPHINEPQYSAILNTMNSEDNEYLFNHAVRHILLLDSVRNEKLFDLLPFKKLALDLTVKNNEYE